MPSPAARIVGFSFVGTAAFFATAGELRYFHLAGSGQTIVDGNGPADFQIALVGPMVFDAGDFLGLA
jgi:hypothetical protein